MKHNKYITLAIIAAASTLASCSDILDETPSSGYDRDNFFANVERAESAVLGVYGAISENTHYGWYQMALPASDDMYFTNRTHNDNQVHDIVHYAVNSTNTWIQTLWEQKYVSVNRANLAIEGIENMKAYPSDERLVQLVAELRFLRAFIAYDLVVNWGDVPFKTESTATYEGAFGARRDREDIYDIIVDDLTFAADNLPWTAAGAPERPGQGAARGMLMRVLMQRAGYSLSMDGELSRPDNSTRTALYRQVLEQWKAFEAAGVHNFHPGGYAEYFKNTSAGIANPVETLWEIPMTHEQGRRNGSAWGVYIGPAVATPDGISAAETNNFMGRANGFFYVVPEWQSFYEATDERRDINICTYRFDWNSANKQHVKNNRPNTSWYVGKWRREWMSSESWNKNLNYADVNFCPLRYADIVLLAAEAANELGDTPLAWELINRVRERAGATAVGTGNYAKIMAPTKVKHTLTFIDDSTEAGKIRTVLYFERGLELAFEGQRKYDLIRWGVLGRALRLFGQASVVNAGTNLAYPACRNFVDGRSELLPVPLKEIQSNPLLEGKNNPGY
ncbi:MAG: RagB/SusD family nutrient uptake outer membrane protein [Bacteroidales bacterium]|nr:RagB/SusD family nutrient uptake outer membrane protein [Bacteroidales bacterium]